MKLDVKFTENSTSFAADFGEAIRVSDGGYDQGYAEGHAQGYTEGEAVGHAAGRIEGYNSGYESGHAVGKAEGIEQGVADGKQAEYDRFWDAYQDNGNKDDYGYAFAGKGWTDETYNPKYPIISTGGYTMQFLFAYSLVTDTKVPIKAKGIEFFHALFTEATKLKTIRKLIIGSPNGTRFTDSSFRACTSLQNITVEGIINGQANRTDPNFQWSPLTVESMKNIILCLRDYTGTQNEFLCTVKFSDACWAELLADGTTAPDGSAWDEYVMNTLSWNI